MMKYSVSALLLLLLTACGGATGQVVSEELEVLWTGPLTGDAANIGIPNLRGVELAVDKINREGGINGTSVRLIVEDDGWEQRRTATIFNTYDVPVMFGSTYGAGLALTDTAEQRGQLIVNTLDVSEEIAAAGDGLAAIGIYDEGIGYALAEGVQNDGRTDVVVLSIIDPFTELVGGAFLEKQDATLIKYDGGTTDFRPILLKAQRQKPDALVLLGWDEIGLIMKQAREMGIDAKIYAIDTVMSETVQVDAGDALLVSRSRSGSHGTTACLENSCMHTRTSMAGNRTTCCSPLQGMMRRCSP